MELPVQVKELSNVLSLPFNSLVNCLSLQPEKGQQQLIFKTLSGEKIEILNWNSLSSNDQLIFLNDNVIDGADIINSNKCVDKLFQDPSIDTITCGKKQGDILTKPQIKRKSNPIKCPLCQRVFGKLSQYRSHMKKHQNPKRFQCGLCKESYNKEVNYKIHSVLHDKGIPICPICNRKFQRHASLKAHLIMHEVEETYTCLHCKAEFEKEDELNRHLEVHEGDEIEILQTDTPMSCEYCNYLFNDADKFKEHLRLHIQAKRFVNTGRNRPKTKLKTREYPHKCKDCSKSFPKSCLLERHRRSHTGERPFICPICKKGFTQKGALQIHLHRHEGKKPHKCMFCQASFVQKGNLRVHLEKTHTVVEPGEKLYKCSHCTCVFKKISSLNGHVTRVHSNCLTESEQPDIINIISQLKELDRQTSTPQKQNLQIPSTNDNYQSTQSQNHEVPNVSYVKIADSSINGDIRNHLIKQSIIGEHRLYLCSYCNKEFKKPSDLIRHIRTHTREKPYECPECGLMFAQKSTVTNHLATHLKNEFECNVCKKKFGSTRSLNLHLKKHEQLTAARKTPCYKCTICDQTFDSLESASVHLQLHEVQVSDENFVAMEKRISKQEMLQPLIATDQGLFEIPPPKPKTPLASCEEYKERPFRCQLCNAAFLRSMHLKRHMYTHSDKKEFTCSICAKQFYSHAALKEHLIYHTKTKSHSCPHCNKCFLNSSMLQRHIICHKSAMPYICPYCRKRFKAKEHCRKHIERHKMNDSSVIAEGNNDQLPQIDANYFSTLNTDGLISVNNLLTNNVISFQHKNSNVQEDVQIMPLVENPKEMTVPQIQIQEGETTQWFQLLGSTNDNGLLQQLKFQNSEEVLLNQMPELEAAADQLNFPIENAPNLITESANSINNETFNPDNVFNPTFNDLSITPIIAHPKEVSMNIAKEIAQKSNNIAPQDNLILENVQISNGISSKNDINYFNVNFRDYLDVPQLHLPQDDQENSKFENLFVCIKCNGNISNFDLDNHICSVEQNMHEIATVEEILNTNSKIQGGENTPDSPEDSFTCTKCNKSFIDKVRLNRHISAKHKVINDNTCQFCQKIFKKKSDLERHVRTHTGEKPFSCLKCDRKFAIKSTLVSHLRTHNPTEIKDVQCKVCNAYLSCKSSLKTHTLIHNDKQPFVCEICNKTFRHNHHKTAHMLRHRHTDSKKTQKVNAVNILQSLILDTNKKIIDDNQQQITMESAPEGMIASGNLFAQELPGILVDNMDPVTITFTYPSIQFKIDENHSSAPVSNKKLDFSEHEVEELPGHMPTKEKKIQCDACKKYYVSKSVLKKHQRALHGDHKCDKCSKAFNSIELLENHYSLHYGHRPFSCTLCTNSFSTEASLKVHMKRMHPSLGYE